MENGKIDFEKKLDELKSIVEKLESDIPLEEGMKLFESGLKLAEECISALNKTQENIAALKNRLDDVIGEISGEDK